MYANSFQFLQENVVKQVFYCCRSNFTFGVFFSEFLRYKITDAGTHIKPSLLVTSVYVKIELLSLGRILNKNK